MNEVDYDKRKFRTDAYGNLIRIKRKRRKQQTRPRKPDYAP